MGTEQVLYTSKVRIEQSERMIRYAYMPLGKEPVAFGLHSQIAEHYGRLNNVGPDWFTPATATLDYVVAAAGG